jgi:acetyl-CoA C-acetyltransferase
VALDHEEFPRPQTTKEGLSELKTVFSVVRDVPVDEQGTTYGALILQKYPEITEFNHIHHAGNSSGLLMVQLHYCSRPSRIWKKPA